MPGIPVNFRVISEEHFALVREVGKRLRADPRFADRLQAFLDDQAPEPADRLGAIEQAIAELQASVASLQAERPADNVQAPASAPGDDTLPPPADIAGDDTLTTSADTLQAIDDNLQAGTADTLPTPDHTLATGEPPAPDTLQADTFLDFIIDREARQSSAVDECDGAVDAQMASPGTSPPGDTGTRVCGRVAEPDEPVAEPTPVDPQPRYFTGIADQGRRLTPEGIREIRRRLSEGESQVAIADAIGVTQGAVYYQKNKWEKERATQRI